MKTISLTVLLLVISNTFMTIAWYGHLKHRDTALWIAILLSWGIALAEYAFQVPANRIGSTRLSLIQLKVLQECITLLVFTVYAYVAFKQGVKWNNIVSMVLIVLAVFFSFIGGAPGDKPQTASEAGADNPSPLPSTNATSSPPRP